MSLERVQAKSFSERQREFLESVPELRELGIQDWRVVEEKYGGPRLAERNFKRMIAELFAEFDGMCAFDPDDEYVYPRIADMYALFLAARRFQSHLPKWMWAMATHEDFFAFFVPKASNRSKGAWMNCLQTFLYRYLLIEGSFQVHERRHLADDGSVQRYQLPGTWRILVPDDPPNWYYQDSFEFVQEEILHEALRLIENGYRPASLSHMTGSAALAGIHREGGLFSSAHLHKNQKPVLSGEFLSHASNDWGNTKLLSVYTAHGDPLWGYQTLRWFDERPVGFGINQQRQRQTIRENKWNISGFSKGGDDTEIDYGSEGVLVGPMVPMENIDRVYGLLSDFHRLEPWVNLTCPHAELVPWNAAAFIGNHAHEVEPEAAKRGQDPVEAWRQFLASSVPVTVQR